MMDLDDWGVLIDKAEPGEELFFLLSGLADWLEETGLPAARLRALIANRQLPACYPGLRRPYTWHLNVVGGMTYYLSAAQADCLRMGKFPPSSPHTYADYYTRHEAYFDAAGLYDLQRVEPCHDDD